MSGEQLTSDEYPYGRQPPAVLDVRDFPTITRWTLRIWPWMLRTAAVGVVVLLIIAMPVGIVGYRASRRSAMIAELEQLGCTVSFAFERTNDSLLAALPGLFGADDVGDAAGVS